MKLTQSFCVPCPADVGAQMIEDVARLTHGMVYMPSSIVTVDAVQGTHRTQTPVYLLLSQSRTV